MRPLTGGSASAADALVRRAGSPRAYRRAGRPGLTRSSRRPGGHAAEMLGVIDVTRSPCRGPPNPSARPHTVGAEVIDVVAGELAKYRIDDRLREAERERMARAVRRKDRRPEKQRGREHGRWALPLRRLAYLLTASSG